MIYALCISSRCVGSSIITQNVLCIHFNSSLLSVISPQTSGEHNEAVISVHQPRLTRATPALSYNEASETQPAKSDQALKVRNIDTRRASIRRAERKRE